MLKIAALSVALMVQSWTPITRGADGVLIEMDMDSMTAISGKPALWTRTTHKDGSFWMALEVFDCTNRTRGVRTIVQYDKSGRPGKSVNLPPVMIEMTPVVPGTVGESVYLAVCAR